MGVNVKFSDTAERSFYDPASNLVTISRKGNGAVQAEDLCHELIHAATEKGLRLYKEEPAIARQIFTDKQIQAFKEIDELFETSKKIFDNMSDAEFKAHLKDLQERGLLPKDFDISKATKESFTEINYGYKSVYEFVAEQSNPIFSDMLKKQGIWEAIKHAIANFFLGAKSLFETMPTNTYAALRKRYFTILDEYKKPPTKTDMPLKVDGKEPSLFDSEMRLFAKQRTADNGLNLWGQTGKNVDESSNLFDGVGKNIGDEFLGNSTPNSQTLTKQSLFDDNLNTNSAKTSENLGQNPQKSVDLNENSATKSQIFKNKDLKNYQNLIYFLEDNLQKRANSYVDFGGGRSGKVGMATGQQEQRFEKDKIIADLENFLKIKTAPREIDEQTARNLAFKTERLNEQELSDLLAYLKTHTDGKNLKESQIYYKFAAQIKDDLIAVYERDLNEIAASYGLKDYENNVLDFERFRYKDITNAQRNDKKGVNFFRDLARSINNMLKMTEPPFDRIKEYEFLLENIPNYKHLDGSIRTDDILNDFNGMKQEKLLEILQDEKFMKKIKNLSDDEAAAAVKNENLERAKESFRKKYFWDYESSTINSAKTSENLGQNPQKSVNLNENSATNAENLSKTSETQNSVKSQGDLSENSNIQKVADIETKIKELESKRNVWLERLVEKGHNRVKVYDKLLRPFNNKINALKKQQHEHLKELLADDEVDFMTKGAFKDKFNELDEKFNPKPQEYKRDRREAYLDNVRKKREAHAESVEKQAQNERDEITKKLDICKQAIANLPTNTAKEQAFVRMLNNEVAKAEKSMANAPRHFEKLQTPKNAIAKINDNFIRMADEDLKPITESVERYIKDNNLDEYGTANFKIGLRNYILQTKYLKKSDDEILASWGWDKESLDKFKGFLAENSSKVAENPQKAQAVERIQQKFHKDEKYANDLYEWHKDSSPLTKDEDGTPKVFYHGTEESEKFEIFNTREKRGWGSWFSTNKGEATQKYADGTPENVYQTFLKMKNPYDASKEIKTLAEFKEVAKILGVDESKFGEFLRRKKIYDNIKQIYAEKGFKVSEISGYGDVSLVDKNGKFYNDSRFGYDSTGIDFDGENEVFSDFIHFNNQGNFIRSDFDLILTLKKGYTEDTGDSSTRLALEKMGYDGIVMNDYQVAVFNPNQIKAVDNKGSWTDSAGNITKDKPNTPSDKGGTANANSAQEPTHKYFNENSPNILMSKDWIGGGLAGGTLNSFETDENGNVYFNPQGFLKGFVYGAAGTKAVKLALQKSPAIRKKAENFLSKSGEFLDEALKNSNLDTASRQALINSVDNDLKNALDNRLFIAKNSQDELKNAIIASKNKAQVMNDLSIFRSGGSLDYAKMGEIAELPKPLSYDDFTRTLKNSPNARLTSSNNNVYYTTPAGEVKIYLPRAYGHFSKNGKYGNGKEDRQYLTGTLMQILDNPLFVTKDTQDKLYFYKPFKRKVRNANGENEILDLISVSIDKYGRFEYRTTYKDTRNQVLDMINGYEVVYKAKLE